MGRLPFYGKYTKRSVDQILSSLTGIIDELQMANQRHHEAAEKANAEAIRQQDLAAKERAEAMRALGVMNKIKNLTTP